MARRAFIPIALSLLMLAYVSGLALHLHLVWEHGDQGGVACSHVVTEYRCSHGHVHVKRDAGSTEPSSNQPAPSDSPDHSPDSEDACPTCVELAGYAAGFDLQPACSAFSWPLMLQLAIDTQRCVAVAFASHHFSRGPPLLVI